VAHTGPGPCDDVLSGPWLGRAVLCFVGDPVNWDRSQHGATPLVTNAATNQYGNELSYTKFTRTSCTTYLSHSDTGLYLLRDDSLTRILDDGHPFVHIQRLINPCTLSRICGRYSYKPL